MIPTKFRTASGAMLTKALFVESSINPEYVLYSLDSSDTDGYESIQRLFIEKMDLSEYDFAIQYFQDYGHWCRIKEASFFNSAYLNMRKSLEAMLQSIVHNKMLDLVLQGKATHQTLAYLGSKGYIPKEKAGRPSKKQIESEINRQTQEEKAQQKEIDRITAHDPKITKLKR